MAFIGVRNLGGLGSWTATQRDDGHEEQCKEKEDALDSGKNTERGSRDDGAGAVEVDIAGSGAAKPMASRAKVKHTTKVMVAKRG